MVEGRPAPRPPDHGRVKRKRTRAPNRGGMAYGRNLVVLGGLILALGLYRYCSRRSNAGLAARRRHDHQRRAAAPDHGLDRGRQRIA